MSDSANKTEEPSGGIVLTARKLTMLVKIPNELIRWYGAANWGAGFVSEEECDEPLIVENKQQ